MPRRECAFPGCRCGGDRLVEVTASQETLCAALLEVQKGVAGFKRRPDYADHKSKTFLCENRGVRGPVAHDD